MIPALPLGPVEGSEVWVVVKDFPGLAPRQLVAISSTRSEARRDRYDLMARETNTCARYRVGRVVEE